MRAETPMAASTPSVARPAAGETATLTLDEAVRTALENHPQYAAAQLESFLAQTQVREVKANYFPVATAFITAGGATDDGTRLLAGGLNVPSVYDRVGGGIAVTQLITDFGRTSDLSKGAQAHAKSAASAAEATREQVILNAKTSYFAALQAQSVLSVARETRKQRELVARQVQALADNKLKSSLDVSFAQVALEEADLIVQQAEGQSDSAMASLSAAMGYRRRRNFVLTEKPELNGALPDLNAAIEAALKQRPDLARLRYERDAAERVAKAERDANFPTLSAIGTAGNAPWRDGRLEANYAAGAVQLSIPIFAGGAYLAKEKEAQIREEVAEQALRQAEDNVARDVQM
ncbi:MAG TPA: TolC family protein, partial [Opitutaceae bacterium]